MNLSCPNHPRLNFKIRRLLFTSSLLLTFGCSRSRPDPAAEAPPPADVVRQRDPSLFPVDHTAAFPLVAAIEHPSASTLNVTGTVSPDVSREIPVISLASGRVVDIRVRLGDTVTRGQLLMEVQSTDISAAFSQYLKAVNDERLARAQYDRSRLLFDKGAIARSQVEIAEAGEQDAQAVLTGSEQQLKVLGVDKDHPTAAVKVYSPASGVIIAQNVTSSAAAGITYAGSSNAFTIADLSHVWIICDVNERDLAAVHTGQHADIRLNAFPDRTLNGVISEIDAALDPVLRTAKVRIQVENPQRLMRIGMFATATLHGSKTELHAAVPASAVLHLHDRDWVYVPEGDHAFRRVSVVAGNMLPGQLQQIDSGLNPGQQVVANALALQSTVEQ